MINLFAAAAKGQQEITITAGQSQYCFEGLSPDSLYSATVFVQTPNLEGPGVSTRERTREFIQKKAEFVLLLNVNNDPTMYSDFF